MCQPAKKVHAQTVMQEDLLLPHIATHFTGFIDTPAAAHLSREGKENEKCSAPSVMTRYLYTTVTHYHVAQLTFEITSRCD